MRILLAALLAASLGGCVTVMGKAPVSPAGHKPIYRKAPVPHHGPVIGKAPVSKPLTPLPAPVIVPAPVQEPVHVQEPVQPTPNTVVKKRWYQHFPHLKWLHRK